jgi:hypothetical protein
MGIQDQDRSTNQQHIHLTLSIAVCCIDHLDTGRIKSFKGELAGRRQEVWTLYHILMQVRSTDLSTNSY